jgi:tRNA-dihydrouridine synthase 2
MRPREAAIRDQLKMIAGICKESGVACLMNGDVENRLQAAKLVTEYGVDGAMIAIAAEKNSSCFRSEADGGLAPWKEVVEEYIKTAMGVENRWGNTKFLLNHLIPGKQPVYREVTTSKCYQQVCQMLGLDNIAKEAKETDRKLGLSLENEIPSRRGKKNKAPTSDSGNKRKMRKVEEETAKPTPLSEIEIQNEPLAALSA